MSAAGRMMCCLCLKVSARSGHVECFRELMRQCKDDDERRRKMNATYYRHDYHWETLLHLGKNSVEMIREIMGMVDANGDRLISFETITKDDHKWPHATALHSGAEKGNVECFRAMLEMCKDDDERRQLFYQNRHDYGSILHSACRAANGAIVKEVLDWEMRLMTPKEERDGNSSLLPRRNESSLIFALDEYKRTSLFCCKSAEAVNVLMDAYGDDETRLKMIMMKSRSGGTVLHFFSATAASAIFEWAERLVPLYHRAVVMSSADDNAINVPMKSLREYLLFSKDSSGINAAESSEKLELFLSKCVDAKEKIELLRYGSVHGQLASKFQGDSDKLKLIMSHFPSKSDLCNLFCARDDYGTPPLHQYIRNTYVFRDSIAYIMDQFVDHPDLLNRIMRMEDKERKTILHAAVLSERGCVLDVISTMIFTTDSSGEDQIRMPRPGVDPNIGTGKGW